MPNQTVEKNPAQAGPLIIALVSLRNNEGVLRWSGVVLIFLLNPPAIVGIGYKLMQTPQRVELLLLAAGCVIVSILHLIWYHIWVRDGALFDFWSEKLAEVERANGIDGGVEVFASRRYTRLTSSRGRLQHRLEGLAIMLIIAWISLAVVQVVRIF